MKWKPKDTIQILNNENELIIPEKKENKDNLNDHSQIE